MQTQFEIACEKLGIDANILPGTEGLSQGAAKRVIAGYKLEVIKNATNKEDNFVPDFNNRNQEKWTCWLVWSPAVSAFVYDLTCCTHTGTRLGARFWFKNGQTAKKFFSENADLVNDLHSID